MAYIEWTYESYWGIEHVIQHMGRYGGKHEKRADHVKATPEQIRRQNQRNKENRVRRTIQLNFRPGDWWITLKYPRGTRKPIEEVMEDFRRFVGTMRKQYKRRGAELKYIYRVEIGKRGGIHVHLVMNRLNDPRGDLILSDAWTRARGMTPIEDMLEDGLCPADGLAHLDHVRAVGNGKELAEYLVKEQPVELEDGTRLTPEEMKQTSKCGSSRNLIRPVAKVKRYSHWTLHRLLELGPDGINTTRNRYRKEGYAVDKDSWYQGVNPYTGLSYLCYMEIPIRREQKCNKTRRDLRDGCSVGVIPAGNLGSAGVF